MENPRKIPSSEMQLVGYDYMILKAADRLASGVLSGPIQSYYIIKVYHTKSKVLLFEAIFSVKLWVDEDDNLQVETGPAVYYEN